MLAGVIDDFLWICGARDSPSRTAQAIDAARAAREVGLADRMLLARSHRLRRRRRSQRARALRSSCSTSSSRSHARPRPISGASARAGVQPRRARGAARAARRILVARGAGAAARASCRAAPISTICSASEAVKKLLAQTQRARCKKASSRTSSSKSSASSARARRSHFLKEGLIETDRRPRAPRSSCAPWCASSNVPKSAYASASKSTSRRTSPPNSRTTDRCPRLRAALRSRDRRGPARRTQIRRTAARRRARENASQAARAHRPGPHHAQEPRHGGHSVSRSCAATSGAIARVSWCSATSATRCGKRRASCSNSSTPSQELFDQTRSFVFVSDIAEVTRLFDEKGLSESVIAIGA